MYNLLMGASPEFIDENEIKYPTDRLMEYTQDPFVEKYGAMSDEHIAYIQSLPSLAVPEFPNEQPGWLVEVKNIRRVHDGYVFEFEKISGTEPIAFEWLKERQTDLDIAKMEVFRHHYALKDVDLNAALNLPEPEFPPEQLSDEQTKVFIVHGHDMDLRDEVDAFLKRFGIETLIMSEHANQGDPLTTKFIRVAEQAKYAVILLTADDVGRATGEQDDKPRARQNVVFELGYFIGKLGPARVALVSHDEVDHPTDYAGVGRIIHSDDERWKTELVRELTAANILNQ